MPYDPKTLGRTLKRHREAARLTQEELQKKSGVSSKKISRMEQGFTSDPGFGDVIPVAGALGLSPNAIATLVGLWFERGEMKADDPRWEYIQSWLARADKHDKDRWLDMAYSSALTVDRLSAAGSLPSPEDARETRVNAVMAAHELRQRTSNTETASPTGSAVPSSRKRSTE